MTVGFPVEGYVIDATRKVDAGIFEVSRQITIMGISSGKSRVIHKRESSIYGKGEKSSCSPEPRNIESIMDRSRSMVR